MGYDVVYNSKSTDPSDLLYIIFIYYPFIPGVSRKEEVCDYVVDITYGGERGRIFVFLNFSQMVTADDALNMSQDLTMTYFMQTWDKIMVK